MAIYLHIFTIYNRNFKTKLFGWSTNIYYSMLPNLFLSLLNATYGNGYKFPQFFVMRSVFHNFTVGCQSASKQRLRNVLKHCSLVILLHPQSILSKTGISQHFESKFQRNDTYEMWCLLKVDHFWNFQQLVQGRSKGLSLC